MDAMDLFYSGAVDSFCLVSSDSDFTGLEVRLRELGMFIVVMSMKTMLEPMVAACNSLKFLDVIDSDAGAMKIVGLKSEAVSELCFLIIGLFGTARKCMSS